MSQVISLLPAVGMALLLQMLWSAQLAVYFFLGFILNIYLGLPMIAIAGIGVIFAAIQAFRDKELFDMEHKGIATAASGDAATSEEEDFFA